MLKIVDRLVKETNELLLSNDSTVKVSISDIARQQLADDGYEPTMGARPLKRVFEEKVKKPLSRKILFDDLKNIRVHIDFRDGEYVIG